MGGTERSILYSDMHLLKLSKIQMHSKLLKILLFWQQKSSFWETIPLFIQKAIFEEQRNDNFNSSSP